MSDYQLEVKDYELIKELIRITSSVEKLYRKLLELELSGKKNTTDYQNIVCEFKASIDEEKKVYEKGNLNLSKCGAIIDYIAKTFLPDNFKENTESIMMQDYNNKVLRRILNILKHKAILNSKSVKEMLPEEIPSLLYQIGISNPGEIVSQAINSSVELNKAFEKDILNGFIVFLNQAINRKNNEAFKKDLICSKYYISFVNPIIEDDMMSNNFDAPKVFYVGSRLVADLTQTDLKLYELLKNTYAIRKSTKQITKLLEMKDDEYSNPKNIISSILRQCFIRSTFLLMSDEVLSSVNNEFHDFIETEEYLKEHRNDHKGEENVIRCFKLIKYDRSIPNVLSLGYRKK